MHEIYSSLLDVRAEDYRVNPLHDCQQDYTLFKGIIEVSNASFPIIRLSLSLSLSVSPPALADTLPLLSSRCSESQACDRSLFPC